MTRDDLKRFHSLDIDFDAIGLSWAGGMTPYFCTPVDGEYVGSLGCDGVHFILLPGDERVFCVEPSMGELGTYVLPVGGNFREFLSFVLYCWDANPLSQVFWMSEERFYQLLEEDAQLQERHAQKEQALAAIAKEFGLTAVEPYHTIKRLQREFDPSVLRFSDEYYDTLGIECV